MSPTSNSVYVMAMHRSISKLEKVIPLFKFEEYFQHQVSVRICRQKPLQLQLIIVSNLHTFLKDSCTVIPQFTVLGVRRGKCTVHRGTRYTVHTGSNHSFLTVNRHLTDAEQSATNTCPADKYSSRTSVCGRELSGGHMSYRYTFCKQKVIVVLVGYSSRLINHYEFAEQPEFPNFDFARNL